MPFTPSPFFLACVSEAVDKSVGKPWVCAARGPESFDCWGFVVWVWSQGGVSLPDWLYSIEDRRQDLFKTGLLDGWDRVKSSEQVSIVTLGRRGSISHVAIQLKGKFYHCSENMGVVASSKSEILRIFDTLDYWWPK